MGTVPIYPVQAWPATVAHEEIHGVPLILREEGSGTLDAITKLLSRRGGDAELPALHVGSTEAAKRCARAGLGITFISRRAVAEELAAKTHVEIAFPGIPVKRSFWTARLRGVTLSTAARALLRLLVEGDEK